MAFAYLESVPPNNLALWTDGYVPLPLSFGKNGSGVLANCSLCGTEATLFTRPSMFKFFHSFHQAQYLQVFPLKPAPFCMFFAGLSSTNKSVVSLLFSSLTLAMSSPPCPLLRLSFCLNLSGRSGRNCLFFLFYQATMDPRTLVFPGDQRGC